MKIELKGINLKRLFTKLRRRKAVLVNEQSINSRRKRERKARKLSAFLQ